MKMCVTDEQMKTIIEADGECVVEAGINHPDVAQVPKPKGWRYYPKDKPNKVTVIDSHKYDASADSFWVSPEIKAQYIIEPLYTLDQAKVLLAQK